MVSIVPSQGAVGEDVTLFISAVNTGFDSTTTVTFGASDPALTVNSVTALDATTLEVDLSIAESATPGFRNVDIRTGVSFLRAASGFLVTPPPPPLARVLEVTPAEGGQGATGLEIEIVGEFTNFEDGVSVAAMSSAGVTVVDTVVSSPTSLVATLDIDPGAEVGFADVSVTTGDEVAVLIDGFVVVESVTTTMPLPESGDIMGCLAPGDEVAFAFSARVGDELFRAKVLGDTPRTETAFGSLAPEVSVFGPDGSRIANASDAKFVQIDEIEILEDGEYVVEIGSSIEGEGGCYLGWIEVVRAPEKAEDDPKSGDGTPDKETDDGGEAEKPGSSSESGETPVPEPGFSLGLGLGGLMLGLSRRRRDRGLA